MYIVMPNFGKFQDELGFSMIENKKTACKLTSTVMYSSWERKKKLTNHSSRQASNLKIVFL